MSARHLTPTRWISRTLLCAGLGFLTCFATTAAIAAWSPLRNIKYTDVWANQPFLSRPVQIDNWRRFGVERRQWHIPRSFAIYGPSNLQLNMPYRTREQTKDPAALARWGSLPGAFDPSAQEGDSSQEEAIGWPRLAFWYEFSDHADMFNPGPVTVHGGIALTPTDGSVPISKLRCLPLRPIWGGLIFNSAAYSVAWLALIATGLGARQLRRRNRGLCPACAYDLRHDYTARCPECGWRR